MICRMLWIMPLALAATAQAAGASAPDQPLPIKVDHHVHLDSPEMSEYMKNLCAPPEMAGKCEDVTPHTIEELLRDMDAAGIQKARLLSSGYIAESQFKHPDAANHAELLRSANAFTVALAKAHPDRLEAFVSVNPISPTALIELAYWKGNPDVTGLKIHLTVAGFDFHARKHVRQLAKVFATAAANHLSIVIHMRNREKYGAGEAAIFIRDILPAAKGAPVQIAHLAGGGWDPTDDAALSALGRFAAAFEQDPAPFANVTFDLGAIEPAKLSPERRATIVALMRRIGIDHFVPASDWPVMLDLKAFYAGLRALPLDETELDRLARNVGK